MSKLQSLVYSSVVETIGDYGVYENYRPEWMSTVNGGRLEIDVYIETKAIAVEVQGRQHYEFVPLFHGDWNGFLAQVKRDADKKQILNSRGIKLIEIFSESDIADLVSELSEEKTRDIDSPYMPIYGLNKEFAIKMIRGKIVYLLEEAKKDDPHIEYMAKEYKYIIDACNRYNLDVDFVVNGISKKRKSGRRIAIPI